ncbi:MAG: outer membrane lipoprotein carrier protein LolA [Bdellovibrio sp.]
MNKRTLSVLSIAFLFMSVFQAEAAESALLQKVSKKYRDAKLVEMNVEKSVKSDLLGKETKHTGRIFLAKGKFRWENTQPEKTLLVFDGTTIWSEQSPPKEFGGPVQVAKGKVDKKNKGHVLISSLLGTDLKKNFKIGDEKKEGDTVKVSVQPLNGGLTVKSLLLTLSPKESTLKQISYEDDIGNVTTMKFSNVQFLKTEKSSLFKYTAPKGAQVTDL